GRMVVAGVEAQEFFARDGVAEIKLMRADNVTLAPNAEELGLDGIEVERWRNGFVKNGVERGSESFARGAAVDGCVLRAVRNPDVSDAWRAESLADCGADLPATGAMFNPKCADGLVAV